MRSIPIGGNSLGSMATSLALALALSVAVVGSTRAAAAPARPRAAQPLFEVGQPVPDLVLPAARDGRPMSLADFRGRKTILHVFASW